MLSEIRWLEAVYGKPQGHPWRDEDELYRLYYRDDLTEEEKDEFFKVPLHDLDYFCRKFCGNHDPSWLRCMLADAVVVFKLKNTWQVYICPIPECHCCFPDDDYLVLHLMREHRYAWPFLQLNGPQEPFCPLVPDIEVWKPIDVRVALYTLSTTHHELNAFDLARLEWPLSDDCARSKLLEQLQNGFNVLLALQPHNSFRVRASGCLRALLAVASEVVVRHLDPMNVLPLPFRFCLHRSPLSFRFMEEDSLVHFVDLVEDICILTRVSQNRDLEGSSDDVNRSKRGCHDAVSFSGDCDYIVLDSAKLNLPGEDEKDMGLWMYEAPIFPTVEKLPTKASEILELAQGIAAPFSAILGTVNKQSDRNVLAFCLNIWNMGNWPTPLLDTSSPEVSSNSGSNTANVKDMPAPCCSSREPAKRQSTDFNSQHYLELIKLTWKLQFFELQVRRLCAVDLREYLLPLLKSFFRMKLYMFIRLGDVSVPGDVIEEDTCEGEIMERSQETHSEEHVHSIIEAEAADEDACNVMRPNISFCKRFEEFSTASLEVESSGSSAIGVSISNLDPMMIDSREALEGKPPGASAGCTDSRASQVASADAATSILSGIEESETKPEAIPELDVELESKADSQCSLEAQGPLCCHFDLYSDSDSLSESEGDFKDEGSEMEFSNVVWFMRGKCSWEHKEDGLFVCMTINDVIKHCLEKFGLQTAQKIWEWKTNRTQKYWRCGTCGMGFPDQKLQMLHMKSQCFIDLSYMENSFFFPNQVCQIGQLGADEGVKERTDRLDDSITVDCTYKTFLVEMEKFGSSYQNEEKGEIQNDNEVDLVASIKEQSIHLFCLNEVKKRMSTSKMVELDAIMLQKLDDLKMSLENLSNLWVSDYKNEILPSISSLLQKSMDNKFRSSALLRFNELLVSVRCPCLPDSFSIKLASSGKVIINIEEHSAGITFAYVGLRWEFSGDLSLKGSRKMEGMFMFSGVSDKYDGIQYDWKLILDREIKLTMKTSYFKARLARHFTMYLLDKLPKFQAELRAMLRG